ncbi:cobalt-precorrin 5A hydrolase [Crassaminicella profunda]|uniref:cobalt-precorrin 5A hydrolase n=1 Tax=Crassaminicella profunda TaxID=1286698 RepID=UPI001CA772AE|nr:cobalt-precorrin 5A hydrolase [Crassaminicella profunda]QZY57363.1 cobalt-precorrin 5A hydrolase [Crassaminicella profunda]
MDKAIITLTKGGMKIGVKLLSAIDEAVLYVHPKFYIEGENIKKIHGKMFDFTGEIFHQYRCLIFIMSTGIVVRSIAPYIKDKKTDPAVLVLDEKGKNVISLLSGHIGGANDYTKKIAEILDANPVITTASDVNESMAIDTLAMALDYEIEDFSDATKVTAHIVNGEKVGIVSDIAIDIELPNNVTKIDKEHVDKEFKGLIYVSEKSIKKPIGIDCVVLRPKNIVFGIGCRRGKSEEEILKAVEETINDLKISKKSIKHIATVDIKKNEEGLIKAAKSLKVPLLIVEREDIKKVEAQFEHSEFVKKQIGVGSVCEPVAFLTSKDGKMIQKKKGYDGITIAVFREGE